MSDVSLNSHWTAKFLKKDDVLLYPWPWMWAAGPFSPAFSHFYRLLLITDPNFKHQLLWESCLPTIYFSLYRPLTSLGITSAQHLLLYISPDIYKYILICYILCILYIYYIYKLYYPNFNVVLLGCAILFNKQYSNKKKQQI